MTTSTRLADICTLISSGGTPSRQHPEYFESHSGHPWVKSQELRDGSIRGTGEFISDLGLAKSSAKYYPANTVLLAMYGANVGQLGLLRIPATVNQAVCGLCVDPGFADYRYVFYAILATRQELTVQAMGAAQQNLNQELIRNFEIPLPDLTTQRSIGDLLGAYDELIENNTRRIEILEKMAQAIYREWFGNFRYPGHEDVRLVDSELGPIPTGWTVAAVGDVADLVRGRSYRKEELVDDGGLPFFNLKCMERDGGFRKSGIKRYSGKFSESQKTLPGDIVLAVTDMTQERRIVARAARIPTVREPFGIISLDLAKLVPTPDLGGDYLLGMLRYSGFADEVKNHANGVNVLHLHPQRILDFRFVLPPLATRQGYCSIVAPMFALADVLRTSSEVLRTTRDLLLPRLISGEVDVSDLDIDVGELVS